LLGLLEDEEGRASVLLAPSGLDLAALRREHFPPGLPPAGDYLPPVTAAVRSLFVHARALGRGLTDEGIVDSEALLIALLEEAEAVRPWLAERGADLAGLDRRLAGGQPPPLAVDEPLHLDDPAERIDTARALDAAANRAREALRVVEDYCRFVLDDAFLCGEVKQLRHDLTAALSGLPPPLLLEAREALRDVGAGISTAAERSRHSLPEVAQANLKRWQEALRSLEEFGKLLDPRLGESLEALRYRGYTLERAVLLGADARERLAAVRLCVLVTGSLCTHSPEWTVREAAAGGASMFQLREKGLSDRDLLERARQMRRWTREAGALFVVNDRPDIARLAEADGVHLGQDDLPVKEARRILGPGALVGVSTHDLGQLRQAIRDGASYVGVGPTFPSGTKQFGALAGLDYVRQAAAETSLPAFVIGGVGARNVAEVAAAGGRRVAVSQAVCGAESPRAAAVELLRHLP
ncbi:MAG TPA: thiamine phosphate synthase, partial [Gemmataceae bacterium]|nr:thiamine phosphate synthase [Gemmataceae bacterium]